MTINRHLLALSLAFLTTGLVSLRANLMGLNISAAKDYNLLVFGDAYMPSSDTQGKVAVGGNMDVNSYSVGDHSTVSSSTDGVLVVGGNLTYPVGQVYHGSVYVGGSFTGPSSGSLVSAPGAVVSANLGKTNVGFDFDAAEAALLAKSAYYGSLAANGTTEVLYSTLKLTGTNADVNIFTVDSSLFSTTSELFIYATAGSQVLVNLTGTSSTWDGGLKIFWGTTVGGVTTYAENTTYSSSNVLYNFYQSTSLTMSGIGVYGSVLAPTAAVNFTSGQLNGQLIAGSFTGTGEMHNFLFDNYEEPPIPEPSTYGLMGAASLLGLGFLRRRKARKQV